MRDPFCDGKTITGMPLLEMIDWVAESDKFLRSEDSAGDSLFSQDNPIIGLPPIQRSSVWRPRQIVDLWNSLMRGLPIGLFYLVKQNQGERPVVTHAGKTKRTESSGYDLLDGQQRIRALLLGATDISEERRCLWVDLSKNEESQLPLLRITSKGQPFGYDTKTGIKLGLEERKRARENLEKDGKLLRKDGKRAADRDLFDFDEDVTQNGEVFRPRPPLPYGGGANYTFKLCDLLTAWRKRCPSSSAEGVDVLRTVAGNEPGRGALIRLHQVFERIRNAEVALLCVNPVNFLHGREDLLPLFDRIGAGGTPLSADERLYSIYKYRYPYIRDAVNKIYEQAGRVLSPTKIAATAIRIAYAQTGKDRNDMPDVAAFSMMMRDEQEREFKARLRLLVPPDAQGESTPGILLASFKTIKNLLSYNGEAGHFWIPDVLLASLSPELWQVLTFWAVTHLEAKNLVQTREEMVRFALFWHLCVFKNEKAALGAFAVIKESEGDSDFPGEALYRRFIGNGEHRCAHELIASEKFRRELCTAESSAWKSDIERFVDDHGNRKVLLSDWWWNGRKMLPWLQRDYIRHTFPDYVPLDDHEDDVPYDIDHLCPAKDWGDDWRNLRNRLVGLDQNLIDRVYRCKSVVGGGVGNLRLIEFSQNRKDQDDDVSDKMQCILGDDQLPQVAHAEEMAKFAFAPEHRGVWKKIACPGSDVADRKWDEPRLEAFQEAVELRAAWLYERFYQDLDYEQWTNGKQDS